MKPLVIHKVYDYYFLSADDVSDLRHFIIWHGKGTESERNNNFLGACIDMARERTRLYAIPAIWTAKIKPQSGAVIVRRVRNHDSKRVRKVDGDGL